MGLQFLPEKLKAWRERARLRQDEAAKMLGVGRTYYSKLETGKKTPGKFLIEKFELLEREPVPSVHILKYPPHGSVKESPSEGRPTEVRLVISSHSSTRTPREVLQAALAEHGLSSAQLAKKTGYDASILENVIYGAGKLSKRMAEKIVEALPGLDIDFLLSGSDVARIIDPEGFRGTAGDTPSVEMPGGGRTRIIPLISWASAGALTAAGATDDAWDGEGIMSNVPGRTFAVEIEGDSMYPEISPGDYAVVRKDIEPRPGQVVLVKTIHGDVLCKRYSTRDGAKLVILSSVNKTYEPYEIPASEIAWIYPVKQVIRNY